MAESVLPWRDANESSTPEEMEKATGLVISFQQVGRSIMMEQLRQMGITSVAQATRWREARAKLEGRKYDVIMCDHDLGVPKETGLALIDELRRTGLLPTSTIVILVADVASYAEVLEAAESGVNAFLIRPYSLGDITARVMSARRRRVDMGAIFDRIDAGRYEEAFRAAMQFYQERRSDWMYAARLAAELLIQLGRPLDARPIYNSLIEQTNHFLPWAKLGLARIMMLNGEQAEAVEALNALLLDSPSQVEAYDLLGRAYLELGQEEEALRAYQRAVDSTPASLGRLLRLGFASMFCGHEDQGAEALTRAMRSGLESRLFDPQAMVLLAGYNYRHKDVRCLDEVCAAMVKMRARLSGSSRVQRAAMIVAAFGHLLKGETTEAAPIVKNLMEQSTGANFDFEAACNLVMLLSLMKSRRQAPETADECIEEIGHRFSSSKLTSMWLMRAAQDHEPYAKVLAAGFDAIFAKCQGAVRAVTEGRADQGLSTLIDLARSTKNVRAIEMAEGAVNRYAEKVEDPASLKKILADLRGQWGVAANKKVPGDHVLRDPGVMSILASRPNAPASGAFSAAVSVT